VSGFVPGVPGMPQQPGGGGMAPQGAPGVPQGPAVGQPMVFELDMEHIRRQAQELAANPPYQQKESDFYSFQKGLNYIRVLPAWSQAVASQGHFTKYHVTHFQLGADGKGSAPCWEASLPNMGFKCPICHIRNTFGRYMGEAIKNSEGRGYHYCNAVIYDSPDGGGTFSFKRLKPYVLRLPVTVWMGLYQMMNTPYIGNITSIDSGWIIAVNKPESFKGKSGYSWQHVVQGPLADEQSKAAIIADIHNLDTFADFGIPTVEKLQRLWETAKGMLQWACAMTQVADPASQIPGFGSLGEPVIPDIVYQTHGKQTMVPGMAGSTPPQLPQAAVPQAVVPQVAVPQAFTQAPTAAPAPQAFTQAPTAAPAPQAFTQAPTAAPGVPSGVPAAPMGGAPGMPPGGPAPMPALPAGPMPQIGVPQAPPPGVPPAAAPAPQVPQGMPVPQAPQVGPVGTPPAPAPNPQAGGQFPYPFPQAPDPQHEAACPTGEGSGEAQKEEATADGKVKCPGCGKAYKRLKAHLAKSPECQKAAQEAPVPVESVAPAAQPEPQVQPAPVAPPAPVGMAAPNWDQTGPFPQT